MALLFLFFCLVVADINTYYQECQTLPRNSLLPCFSSLIDTDSDGDLNQTEVLNFLGRQNMTAPVQNAIMEACDTNSDGLLNMVDWNAASACLRDQPMVSRVCYTCVNVGWIP
jgi:hypothetical protein